MKDLSVSSETITWTISKDCAVIGWQYTRIHSTFYSQPCFLWLMIDKLTDGVSDHFLPSFPTKLDWVLILSSIQVDYHWHYSDVEMFNLRFLRKGCTVHQLVSNPSWQTLLKSLGADHCCHVVHLLSVLVWSDFYFYRRV